MEALLAIFTEAFMPSIILITTFSRTTRIHLQNFPNAMNAYAIVVRCAYTIIEEFNTIHTSNDPIRTTESFLPLLEDFDNALYNARGIANNEIDITNDAHQALFQTSDDVRHYIHQTIINANAEINRNNIVIDEESNNDRHNR